MTTFGYSLAYYWYTKEGNSTDRYIYANVRFVYPGSPAEKAGLKRGDRIVKMNGQDIPYDNYTQLVYASSFSFELSDGRTGSMKAEYMYEDPIVFQNIIEKGGKKIGYLFYTD